MKRFLVFISLHLFLFLLIIAYQAQANEDDWNVITSDEFIVTTKPGEVIWGDKLSLVIRKNDCARMNIVFSFSTKSKYVIKNPLSTKNISTALPAIPFV